MEYTKITDDLNVSKVCLGTMMWGDQVSQDDAFLQMDMALERGVNFWDTAELYAVPPKAETYGNTEKIIGEYFKKNPSVREKIVLASKVAGKGDRSLPWIRGGNHILDKKNIIEALEDSLTRMGVEAIDLYQMHWPDRAMNIFGKRYYEHNPENQNTPILETLDVLAELKKQGKIRAIGVSNESPWGLIEWKRLAEKYNLPCIATVQNPYNLLNRLFEVSTSEVCMREDIKMLAYSPLAFGVLSGKYLNDQTPKGSRWDLFPEYAQRFKKPQVTVAVEKYAALAKKHGLTLPQMALVFVYSRPFMSSTIIGATNTAQLQENIDAFDITLSPEIFEEIEKINALHPDPCA